MKSFRDPVHNLIAFGEEDRLILDLINTSEVQRLRRIRQLGLSNIAYPGAEHSRFVHSLGVAHIMRRFLDDPLRESDAMFIKGVKDFRHVALASALLHDVGHGPFSHAIETITGERHENWTVSLLRSPHTEIHQVLEQHEQGMAQAVADVIDRSFQPSRAIVKLVSSQIDMDRTDYLLRDAMMTGAGYGSFDVEWLLHVMRIGEVDGEPEVGLDLAKGKSIAEDYVMSRYYMYLHVYFHQMSRAAEVLIEKMLLRAKEIGAFLPFLPSIDALLQGSLRSEDPTAIQRYLGLDDAVIWTAMHIWQGHDDPVLSDLAQRILHRRLYKAVVIRDDEHALTLRSRLLEEANRRKLPAPYYVITDRADSSAYKDDYLSPVDRDASSSKSSKPSQNVFLFDDKGLARELSQESFIVEAVRNRAVSVTRMFYPSEWGIMA